MYKVSLNLKNIVIAGGTHLPTCHRQHTGHKDRDDTAKDPILLNRDKYRDKKQSRAIYSKFAESLPIY